MTDVRVLTCKQAAAETAYTPKAIRLLISQGRFPPPIDPTLSKRMWRWSSLAIEAYKAGDWAPVRGAA